MADVKWTKGRPWFIGHDRDGIATRVVVKMPSGVYRAFDISGQHWVQIGGEYELPEEAKEAAESACI